MAKLRAYSPVLHFEDDKGHPLAGGWLYTYLAGTNTPVATYNSSGTSNPVQIQLDSRGECEVWLDETVRYKFVLLDAQKSQPPIWTEDDVSVAGGSGGGAQLTPGPNIYISPSGVISTDSVALREGHNVSITSSYDPQTRKVTYVINASGGGASYSAGEAIGIAGNAISVKYGFGLKVNGSNQLEATGALRDAGSLEDANTISVPNNAISHLTTSIYAHDITLDVDVGYAVDTVLNFAVEIEARADATLSVTKSYDEINEYEDFGYHVHEQLRYSADAGNQIEAGKFYQVTCVGSCWTLAEFVQPVVSEPEGE